MIWVPESPRFLISTGRIDEARKVFTLIAKWNKKEFVWDEMLFKTNYGQEMETQPD
jgi:hypothetical protein